MSGTLEAIYEAHCGLCERPARALGKNKPSAITELRRLGWREHMGHGWTCAECRKPYTQSPSPQPRDALRSALVDVPAVEADYWTSHNNFENMLGKGVTDEKGGAVWDFALQTWVNADVPLYTHPPLREGEDSAEVERLRGLLDVALDVLDLYSDPTSYIDSDGEPLPANAEIHEGVYAKKTASSIRAALTATRSASATTAKGCAE